MDVTVEAETLERTLARVVTTPPAAPGFMGAGHTAVQVLSSDDLAASDPFVMLADDRLVIPERRQVGGAHPHAGLETVTLLLEGALDDRDEGRLAAGDAVWMSAGRGVIHNEAVEAEGRARVLQLWVRLPASDRGMAPTFEVIREASLPIRRERGAEIRLYSGSSGGLVSPTRNRAPVTMIEGRLAPGASVEQELPASYNGFVYVLDGTVRVGPDGRELVAGQVGWLDRPRGPASSGASVLRMRAPVGPARFVLYAGQPQDEPLVHRGPFVAGSTDDIVRLYQEFRSGRFELLSRVAARQSSS